MSNQMDPEAFDSLVQETPINEFEEDPFTIEPTQDNSSVRVKNNQDPIVVVEVNKFGEVWSIRLGTSDPDDPNLEDAWRVGIKRAHGFAIKAIQALNEGLASRDVGGYTGQVPPVATPTPQGADARQIAYGTGPQAIQQAANGAAVAGQTSVVGLSKQGPRGNYTVFTVHSSVLPTQQAEAMVKQQVMEVGIDFTNVKVFDNRASGGWDVPDGSLSPKGSPLKVVISTGAPGSDTLGNKAAFWVDFDRNGEIKAKPSKELSGLPDTIKRALQFPKGSAEQNQILAVYQQQRSQMPTPLRGQMF